MLKDDFYTILDSKRIDDSLSIAIRLNPDHDIFKGHFPEIPIVPGVVMMQITKEVLEADLKCELLLFEAKQIKFLDFINPKELLDLNIEINIKKIEAVYKIQALIKSLKANHFKISAQYKPIETNA